MEPSRNPKTKKAPGLRPIGSLMPSISSLEANLASTKEEPTPNAGNSEITGRPKPASAPASGTGTQLSVSGYGKPPSSLDEAQALLATAKPGQVDAAIQAWLPHSVSSRVVARWRGGEHGYEAQDYELRDGVDEADGRESLRLLEMLNARAELEDCQKELARLKVLTAARNLGQADLVAQIAIYAEELTEYPIDVVREACRWWAAREKWFPSWAELRAACDERVMKRRAILAGLRRYFGA